MPTKIESDTLSSVAFQVLGYISTFLIGTYVVKKLNVPDYGAYAVLNVIIMIAPAVITFNVQEYFFVKIADCKSRGEQLNLFSTVGVFALVASLAFSLLAAFPAVRSAVVGLLKLENYEFSYLLVLGYVTIHSLCLTYLRYYMFTKKVKAYNLLNYLLLAVWVVPILFSTVSVTLIYYSRLGAVILVTILAGFIFYRINRHAGFGYSFRLGTLRTALLFGVGSYVGTVCNILMDVTDKLLLSSMVSNESVGYYNFATMPFVILVSFVAGTVFLIATPYINDMHFRKDEKKYLVYGRMIKYLVSYLAPVLAIVIAFSSNVVMILSKAEYLRVASCYVPLAFSYLVFILISIPKQELYLTRQLKTLSVIAAIGLAVNLAADIVLIRLYDYVGAVYASLGARTLMFVLLLRQAKGIRLVEGEGYGIVGRAGGIALIFALAKVASGLIPSDMSIFVQAPLLFGAVVVLYLFYVAFLYRFRLLDDWELDFLRKSLRKANVDL